MGSTNTTPNISPDVSKKIVIVGFSFAGQNLISAIAKHDVGRLCEIIVIDKSDHFEHIPNHFESLTKSDDFIKKNAIHFDTMASHFNHIMGGRFQFKCARLTNVDHAENKIEIYYPERKKTET